jgi:hypothetical protein
MVVLVVEEGLRMAVLRLVGVMVDLVETQDRMLFVQGLLYITVVVAAAVSFILNPVVRPVVVVGVLVSDMVAHPKAIPVELTQAVAPVAVAIPVPVKVDQVSLLLDL